MIFNNKKFVYEEAVKGDFAFVKATKADKLGNLSFNYATRNFNTDIMGGAKICIAEVEEIVEVGELKPEEIHAPGIYVDYIYKPPHFAKIFEKYVYKRIPSNKPGAKISPKEKIA